MNAPPSINTQPIHQDKKPSPNTTPLPPPLNPAIRVVATSLPGGLPGLCNNTCDPKCSPVSERDTTTVPYRFSPEDPKNRTGCSMLCGNVSCDELELGKKKKIINTLADAAGHAPVPGLQHVMKGLQVASNLTPDAITKGLAAGGVYGDVSEGGALKKNTRLKKLRRKRTRRRTKRTRRKRMEMNSRSRKN